MAHRHFCDFLRVNASMPSIFIAAADTRLEFLGTVACCVKFVVTKAFFQWLVPLEEQCH